MAGGAVAGVIIGVLAGVGIMVGGYMHMKKKAQAATQGSLLKNQSDHGFDEDADNI